MAHRLQSPYRSQRIANDCDDADEDNREADRDGDRDPDRDADEAAAEEDNMDDSEEDTEEASETEMASTSNHRRTDEPLEIKEQMYQDKLANLKKQLEELRLGQHPELLRRIKKLDQEYHERIRLNTIYREYLVSCVERDYILEKNAAVKEYEEKKMDLKENLLTDFEDRRKMIETERATMELTGDSIDVKPTITRKLRRRPNEPLPVPEKRRKPTTGQLVLLLDEKEVENDLKLISRGRAVHAVRPQASNGGNHASSASHSSSGNSSAERGNANLHSSANSRETGSNSPGDHNGPSASAAGTSATHSSTHASGGGGSASVDHGGKSGSQQESSSQSSSPVIETRIEDGKLLYERRWFHRGQPVYVEGADIPRFSANISAIGSEAIWVKKSTDGQRVRFCLSQLSSGKITIKRRAT